MDFQQVMGVAEKRIFIDDRIVIPDAIKELSADERRAMIRRLEEEARTEKKSVPEQTPRETA